jgi:hypothetical protein
MLWQHCNFAGNTALVGTGSWTVTAGGATVTDPSDPNSTVTGLTAGLNTFRWTIDNALCANSNFDEVDITTNVLPTASISGTTEICNGNSTTLTSCSQERHHIRIRIAMV